MFTTTQVGLWTLINDIPLTASSGWQDIKLNFNEDSFYQKIVISHVKANAFDMILTDRHDHQHYITVTFAGTQVLYHETRVV